MDIILKVINNGFMDNATRWVETGIEAYKNSASGYMHSYFVVMLQIDEDKAREIFEEHFALLYGHKV